MLYDEFLLQVYRIVMSIEMPKRELCKRIGKKYNTFMRELNPFDDQAKLGLKTMMDIIRVTGDRRILDLMEEELKK